MSQEPITNRAQAYLRAPSARMITFAGPGGELISATRAWSPRAENGTTDPHVTEDAFMLNIQRIDYAGDIFLKNRKLAFRRQRTSEIGLFDYRMPWRANLNSAYDCINLHLPRAVLSGALEERGGRALQTLRYEPGVPMEDPIVVALVQALVPSILSSAPPNRLFLDHVGWALSAHMAERYGEFTPLKALGKGMLAPWQERRAKERIEAQIGGDLSLADLAAECGLSVGYFARAFKVTTGVPPYQWLLNRRVERAKHLLSQSELSIVEIAFACGFADQSHLTRIFSRMTGTSPASWRRGT